MNTHRRDRCNQGPRVRLCMTAVLVMVSVGLGVVGEAAIPVLTNALAPGEAESGKEWPLPLLQFEGKGGFFVTSSARLVNPPRNGEPVGPSLGLGYLDLGYG